MARVPEARRLALIAVLLAGCSGSSSSQQCPATGEYAGRCRAAVADLRGTQTRIEQAFAAAMIDLRNAPDVSRGYLVSFARPVPVLDLLQSLDREEVRLTDIFTWAGLPESPNPVTGGISADYLGWGKRSPEQIAANVTREGLSFLRQNVKSGLGNQKPEYIREDQAILEDVQRHGLDAFGIRCECSLVQLEELHRDWPMSAVEHGLLAELYQHPIWPYHRLQELIIETGGRYGR